MGRLQDLFRRALAGFVIASLTASSTVLFLAPQQPRVLVSHTPVPQRLAEPAAFSEPAVRRSAVRASGDDGQNFAILRISENTYLKIIS